jgi:hypothetical protein
MRLLEWLLTLLSDIDIWDRHTRRRRRDEPWMADYRKINRQAGYAIFATTTSLAVALGWAAFGPSAGQPPYRGTAALIHWTDLIVYGFVALSLLLAVIRCYQAWTFLPRSFDDR